MTTDYDALYRTTPEALGAPTPEVERFLTRALPRPARVLDFELLEEMAEWGYPGPVSALLLPEGGYAPLNPPEWLSGLDPQLVIISVSAGDYREIPSPETLDALDGYPVLRTDRHGWIELVTDGQEMWVTSAR